jgi:hypothetical protein
VIVPKMPGNEVIARATEAIRATLHTVDVSAVFHMLDEAESAPRSRELRTRARFYDRAIKHWMVVPPSLAQVDTMFDLVVELHEWAVSAKRRMSCA